MPTSASQAFPTLVASFVWLSLLHATWIGLVSAACVAWLFQARGNNVWCSANGRYRASSTGPASIFVRNSTYGFCRRSLPSL